MDSSNRRTFLTRGSLGIAGIGLAVAVPSVLTADPAAAAEEQAPSHPAQLEGPLVAYLRNASTGEFSLLVGEREVSFTDRALAAKLTHAAK